MGAVTVGTAAGNHQFNVTNTGTAPATFYAPTFTGANAADFTLYSSSCTGTLSPGANCYVLVDFTPSVATTENATFNINSNATGSPTVVSLTGTGTP